MPLSKLCQNIIQTICLINLITRDISAENTSGVDNRGPENEGEMSFELFRKYFDKTFDEQN